MRDYDCYDSRVTTLETRRPRGHLIEVFKIFKGFEDVSEDIFFNCHSLVYVVMSINYISHISNLTAETFSFPFVWLMYGTHCRLRCYNVAQ